MTRDAEVLIFAALAEAHGVADPHGRAEAVMDEFYGAERTEEAARGIIQKLTADPASNLDSGPRPLPKHMQGTSECPTCGSPYRDVPFCAINAGMHGKPHRAGSMCRRCNDTWHTQGTNDPEDVDEQIRKVVELAQERAAFAAEVASLRAELGRRGSVVTAALALDDAIETALDRGPDMNAVTNAATQAFRDAVGEYRALSPSPEEKTG